MQRVGPSYAVLHLVIVPVAWAASIAFTTWPLYQPLRNRLPRHPTLSALLMTLLLSAAFVLPALWMAVLLRTEVGVAIGVITAHIKQEALVVPEFIRALPWLGDPLQALIDDMASDPDALRAQVTEWARQGADHAVALIGDVGRNAAKLGFALITIPMRSILPIQSPPNPCQQVFYSRPGRRYPPAVHPRR